jgi:hypothetical protein
MSITLASCPPDAFSISLSLPLIGAFPFLAMLFSECRSLLVCYLNVVSIIAVTFNKRLEGLICPSRLEDLRNSRALASKFLLFDAADTSVVNYSPVGDIQLRNCTRLLCSFNSCLLSEAKWCDRKHRNHKNSSSKELERPTNNLWQNFTFSSIPVFQ